MKPYWLTKDWWEYIFQPVDIADEGVIFRLRAYACRWLGHPYGVIWYSSGMEPDMTCRNCGDDLG